MPIISGTTPENDVFSLSKMLSKYDCYQKNGYDYIEIYTTKEADNFFGRLFKRTKKLKIAYMTSKSYGNDLSDVKYIECFGYAATCYKIACEIEKQFNSTVTLKLSRDNPYESD